MDKAVVKEKDYEIRNGFLLTFLLSYCWNGARGREGVTASMLGHECQAGGQATQ